MFAYSGDFLSPSPPAEKATARQDQAGKASPGNGSRHANSVKRHDADIGQDVISRIIQSKECECLVRSRSHNTDAVRR
jgi:hypothetical protein